MDQVKIGNFITELRKESDMTQEEMAEKLNVNVKSISRWENGNNMPEHSMIVEICKLFNVSVNEFYLGMRVKKAKKIRQIILFYLGISISGVFILPTLGIISPTMIICAFLVPVATLIDLLSLIFTHHDIPEITFEIGNVVFHPALAFPLSIILALLLFIVGMYSWKLLVKYIHFVSNKRKKLYIEF